MRICVFALTLVAAAQPAFAKSHSRDAHHARIHPARAHHTHHFARARIEPAMEPSTITFARTDATDHPVFSDPSFPNRAWRENNWNQSGEAQGGGWGAAAASTQSFAVGVPARRRVAVRNTALDAMIARHAAANGLPAELVHRVVKRESGYNPHASHAGNFGLMQIRFATARSVGYTGSAAGLLNPETNLTYAVKYLAGAYRAAGGNAGRAVSLYASGYRGRGVTVTRVARRAPVPADRWQGGGWGWQSAPVSLGGM
jgi:Transglycosylase SLT domain